MRNDRQISVWDIFNNILSDEDFFFKPLAPFNAPRQVRELQNLGFPYADIYVTPDKEYVIEAALAGIPREKIDLNVQNRCIEIEVDLRENDEDKKEEKRYYVQNGLKKFTHFSNSWSIPAKWDVENLKADFKDGLLTIRIPLKAEEQKMLEKRKISLIEAPQEQAA